MIGALILIVLFSAAIGTYGIYDALQSPGAIVPIVQACVFFAIAFAVAVAARETYLGRRPIEESRPDGR